MSETQTRQELKQAFDRLNKSNLSLTQQLDAAARSVKERRPDFAAAIDRMVGRLKESSAGAEAPQVGDEMPPFYLPDENGRVVSLGDLTARGPVAVTFHRGHWCPFCRISINALVRAHEQVAAIGGQIVAVMPEREQFVSDLRATSNAPFLVLTDMDNGYAMSLGLAIWIGDEMQKIISRTARPRQISGQRHLDAADPGDVRRGAGRPDQGAVRRSRLPQAHGDRGSACRHARVSALLPPCGRARFTTAKKKHGPLLSKGPCLELGG